MQKIGYWIKSFRLRTLPLALSSVILGSLLAYNKGFFKPAVLVGAVLTTLFLQILSNLANDYGDTVHGVDNQDRKGPRRSLQSGEITLKEMKWGIIIFTVLSLFSGVWLLARGLEGLMTPSFFILLALGLVAIAAALKYTIGERPYGYMGLGDVAVFIFFGLTGVMGTYFLQSQQITLAEFLPAISIGLLSTGVLNLNNLRDMENDRTSGKKTVVVLLGAKKGKIYHALLISMALISALVYTSLNYYQPFQLIYFITFPLFIRSIIVVFRCRDLSTLDPELRKLAIATLLFSLTFGFGLIL